MKPLDPQVIFYLERQKQIDEWHNLRKKVARAANAFFATIGEELEYLAPRLGGAPTVWQKLKGSHPKAMLLRPSWTAGVEQRPRVAIGLEWTPSALFDGGYTGVWVNCDPKMIGYERLLEALKRQCEKARKQQEMQLGSYWAAWKYEQPTSKTYWEDLDTFRKDLVAIIEQRWNSFHPQVELALAEVPTQSQNDVSTG